MKTEGIVRGQIVTIPTKLKSALKLKLVLFMAEAMAMANDFEPGSWMISRGNNGIYAITPSGKFYKVKPQLVLLLAKALALAGESTETNWRTFTGCDGVYAIAPNGKYYRININSNGDLKLYRGKNRIYLGNR